MVIRYHDKFGRLSWSPESGLGCEMEPHGGILCHCEQGQDSEAVVDRPYDSVTHICGSFERCRCEFVRLFKRSATKDSDSA